MLSALSCAADAYLASGRWRWGALAATVVLALLFAVGVPGVTSVPIYRIDLDVYRLGGQVWLSGGDLYGPMPPTAAGIALPFTYPPIAAMLFSALTWVPLGVAAVLVTLASIAALWLVLQLVLREVFDLAVRDARWLAVPLVAVALFSEPMVQTMSFGQVNALLMALVVVDVILGRGRWWQGSLVGLAMAIKLTPAVFLAYFLVSRRWRALAMGMVSALVYTGVGFVAAPSASVEYWTHTLRDPGRIGGLPYVSNQSINGILARLSPDGEPSTALWFALCAVLGLSLLWVMWRLVRAGEDFAATTVMAVYALLASPVSWSHHWVWALPALLVVAGWVRRRAGSPRVSRWAVGLVAAGVAVFWSHALWLLPHRDNRELDWGVLAHVVGNSYVWWALGFLVLGFVSGRANL